MINKYFFIKGGSERYMFELSNILRNHGHEVIPFAMRHERNVATPYQKFFVENIEFNLGSFRKKLKNSLRIAERVLYSLHARKRIEALIRRVKPDIAHLHMIEHQISPSILHSLKKFGIPVILTAHQSKMICPNYRLFNWNKMALCEKCLDGCYFHPVIEKCHKDSRVASLLIALESTIHKMMKIYEKNIDIIHVPSRFFQKKFVQGGIPAHKIEQLYYTIRVDDYKPHFSHKNYYVCFGRLERAKGLMTLLRAIETLPSSQLWIIGDGDYRVELEAYVRQKKLDHVRFLGARYGDELKRLISEAMFVVMPSECYDNSPLVIYESFAMGKPVIGSNIGGIPELIDPEETGLLFEAGSNHELACQISFLLSHPQKIKNYGKNARRKAEHIFSPEYHYREILEKYERLIARKQKGKAVV